MKPKTIDDLKPCPWNPRKIEQGAMHGLKRSVQEFGDLSGIVWSQRTGHLVCGHQRLAALRTLYGDQLLLDAAVPCLITPKGERFPIRVVDFDLITEKAANVAANNPRIAGEFTEGLVEILGEIREELPELHEDLRFEELAEEFAIVERPDPVPRPPILKSASMDDLAPQEEEMERLAGRKILIQFSGGKDSSAAALWCRHFLPGADTALIYVDLGADHVGFAAHLHDFAQAVKCPLVVLRSKGNILDVMLDKGEWPRFGYPYCRELLMSSFNDHVHLFDPAGIAIVRGGRLQEKAAASNAQPSRFHAIEKLKGYTVFEPLYFADKNSDILSGSGAPVWSGYARGLGRTACRICPGQRPSTYATIRRHLPEVWAELQDLERRFGPGCWNDRVGNTGRGALQAQVDHYERKGEETPAELAELESYGEAGPTCDCV